MDTERTSRVTGIDRKPCRFAACSGECELRPCESGPHFAYWECTVCHRHNGWQAKPDGDKAKRPASHSDLVRKFGRGFCELCLRTRDELRSADTFEAHHVIEYSDQHHESDGTQENIWILCTACHRLVNWIRTYFGSNECRPQ